MNERERQIAREKIQRDTEAFLKMGGKIKVCKNGDTAFDDNGRLMTGNEASYKPESQWARSISLSMLKKPK